MYAANCSLLFENERSGKRNNPPVYWSRFDEIATKIPV